MGSAVVSALSVRLFGSPGVTRAGVEVALPRSRKIRALLGFLALSPRPVSRSRLCELLWDVPNDPRGELRWFLSKLRGVLDDDDRRRVVSTNDTIALDLSDCRVDALELEAAANLEGLATPHLEELAGLFVGDLLDGGQLDGTPELTAWLTAQRHRFRALHADVVGVLATRATSLAETLRWLEAWLQFAPFELRAHEVMVDALVKHGQRRAANEHLTATIRSFEEAGLDWQPLRELGRTTQPLARIEPEVTPLPVERVRGSRASIAVMPFADRAARPSVAEGLTEDIIMQLAKLRVLFVIARGSVFALAERGMSPHEASQILNVDYAVSGSVRSQRDRIVVSVELVDARSGRIVWTDVLEPVGEDTFAMLDGIVARIVAAISEQVEMAECQRAVLKSPTSLDAWEAYHRGLWHVYKFDGRDNRIAEQFFRTALELDPTFARAHAGLSFTHFSNVFLELTPDRTRQIELALETAGRSVGADDQDPSAHWALGRALWLRGAQDQSLAELKHAIALSPNFALGHYMFAFVHAQSGDPHAAIESSNYSRQLSPFDPMLFGFLGSRALAHVRLEQFDEAAEWAVRAASRPNSHVQMLGMAAHCLALARRRDEARTYVDRIREHVPRYTFEHFTRAFRFAPETVVVLRGAARELGIG